MIIKKFNKHKNLSIYNIKEENIGLLKLDTSCSLAHFISADLKMSNGSLLI